MTFNDAYVSGEFLSKLYDALCSSRLLFRSMIYDEPCGISAYDMQIVLFLLICQMEEMGPCWNDD